MAEKKQVKQRSAPGKPPVVSAKPLLKRDLLSELPFGLFDHLDAMLDKAPPNDEVQARLNAEPFIKSYRKKIVLSAASVFMVLVCLSVFYVSAKAIKPPPVVLMAEDGSALDFFKPMGLPNQSQETIQQYATELVQKIYTVDFLNMEKQLSEAEPYFTPGAWSKFVATFPTAEIYKTALDNKLSISVVPTKQPVIASTFSERKAGDFAWVVEVPVLLSFSGDIKTQSRKRLIRVTIIRVPTTENPKGLGVQQLAG